MNNVRLPSIADIGTQSGNVRFVPCYGTPAATPWPMPGATREPFRTGSGIAPSSTRPAIRDDARLSWSTEVQPNYYVVRDADGQQLAYVYFDNPRAAATPLTKDEARRIAASFAITVSSLIVCVHMDFSLGRAK